MIRRVLLVVALAAAMVGLTQSLPASAATQYGFGCARHDRTPSQRFYICGWVQEAGSFNGNPGVQGVGQVYSNLGTSVLSDVIDVWLWYTNGIYTGVIAQCTRDNNGSCDIGHYGVDYGYTNPHGPCRVEQRYYVVVRGQVRWSDGTWSNPYYYTAPLTGRLPNCAPGG
jgi:hypothetical protein